MKNSYLLSTGLLLLTLTACGYEKKDEIIGHTFEYNDHIYKFQSGGHEEELDLGKDSDNKWEKNTYSLEYDKENKVYNLYVDGEKNHYVIKKDDIDEDGFIGKNEKKNCHFKRLSNSEVKKNEKKAEDNQNKLAKKELDDVKVYFSGCNGEGKATTDDEEMTMNTIDFKDEKVNLSKKDKLKNGDKITLSLFSGKKEIAKKELTVQGLLPKDFNVKNKAEIKKRLEKELAEETNSYTENGKNEYRESHFCAYSPKTGRVVGISVVEDNENSYDKKKKPKWEVISSAIVTHKKALLLKNNEAKLNKDDDFYGYADVEDIANPGIDFDEDRATLNDWKKLLKKEGYILF